MRLTRRLERLEALVPTSVPDIAPEWWDVAERNPEARARALALTERRRELWPDREPTAGELLDDTVCFDHVVWLESVRHGGLANFLALAWSEP